MSAWTIIDNVKDWNSFHSTDYISELQEWLDSTDSPDGTFYNFWDADVYNIDQLIWFQLIVQEASYVDWLERLDEHFNDIHGVDKYSADTYGVGWEEPMGDLRVGVATGVNSTRDAPYHKRKVPIWLSSIFSKAKPILS